MHFCVHKRLGRSHHQMCNRKRQSQSSSCFLLLRENDIALAQPNRSLSRGEKVACICSKVCRGSWSAEPDSHTSCYQLFALYQGGKFPFVFPFSAALVWKTCWISTHCIRIALLFLLNPFFLLLDGGGVFTHPCFIYFCGCFFLTLKKCCGGVALYLVKQAVIVFGVKANAAPPFFFSVAGTHPWKPQLVTGSRLLSTAVGKKMCP